MLNVNFWNGSDTYFFIMEQKVSLNLLVVLLAVLMGSFLFVSCGDKDDDEPENPEVAQRDELSNSSWKLVSITGYMSSQTSKWKGDWTHQHIDR